MLVTAVVALVLSAAVVIFGAIPAVVAAIAFAVMAVAALFLRKKPGVRTAIPALVLIAAFSLSLIFRAAQMSDISSLAGKAVTVSGYVCEEPEYHDVYTAYTVRVRGKDADAKILNKDVKLKLYSFSGTPLDAFDEFSANVTLRELPSSTRLSSLADGVFLTATADSVIKSGTVRKNFYYYAVKLRRHIRNCFLDALPADEASVINGVLLGDKSYMSSECYSGFVRCGIIHIITVSGMHLSIICFTLLELMKRMGFGVKTRYFAAFIAVVAVMAVSGFAPSILRASAMFILAAVGRLIRRDNDPLNLLGCAVFIILCVNPFAVFSLQLLLSSFATAGILVVMPVVNKRILSKVKPGAAGNLLSYLVIIASQSLAAVLFTLPVNAIYFHRLSVISPLASVLTVFPVTIMLITSVISCAVSAVPFLGFISNPFILFSGLLAKYILFIVRLLSRTPFAVVPLGSGFFIVAVCAAVLLLLFTALRFPNRRTIRLSCVSAIFLLTVSITAHTVFAGGSTTVTVLAQEDGQSASVLTRGGHAIIVCGSVSKSDGFAMDDVLAGNNVNCIDLFLLCDSGKDSRRGVMLLLDRYDIACIAVPDGTRFDGFYGLRDVSCVPLSDAVFNLWGDTDLKSTGSADRPAVQMSIGRSKITLTESTGSASMSIQRSGSDDAYTVVTGGYASHADGIDAVGRIIDLDTANSKISFLIKNR